MTGPVADLLDGYLWTVPPTDQAEAAIPAGATGAHTSDDPFAALAARQLILAEMQRNRGRSTRPRRWTLACPGDELRHRHTILR
jgi:hypothetical protein